MVIYCRSTGGEGRVKGHVPIVLPTPKTAKRGTVTSLQVMGGGVDHRDVIVSGVDIEAKKLHFGLQTVNKSPRAVRTPESGKDSEAHK